MTSLLPLLLLLLLHPISTHSNPNPPTLQPFLTDPSSSPPVTIPAFPEQSDLTGCHLTLPDQFYHSIKTSCSTSGQLKKGRCCPILASWLYSAYSATALGLINTKPNTELEEEKEKASKINNTMSFDMPMLPDDSETCVGEVDKALRGRGIELVGPNETCDVVYCYCGIRLHPLSCPEAFSIGEDGKVRGDKRVRRLERDCYGKSGDVNGFPGLGGCSKCLNALHLLNNNNNNKALNTSKLEDRTTKMHNKDCQLMGLTWLLAKNRTAYMRTVSAVLRAIMLSSDEDSDQLRRCPLTSDGMPLAVDSSELSDQSSSTIIGEKTLFTISLFIAFTSFLYCILFIA
ncbi:hypothetical protein CsatB_016130 [Cannabis sativa]